MNLIIQALQDLWGQIEDVIGTEVLNTILAVTLILFVYFLFIRLFLLICKASKNVKLICDIVVVVICLMVVLNNLLPTFKVEKEVTGIGDGSGGSSVIVNPEITGIAEVLTGLEVDGVKYELPESPHLYRHDIVLSRFESGQESGKASSFRYGCYVFFTLYSSLSSFSDVFSLSSYLENLYSSSSSRIISNIPDLPCSGYVISAYSFLPCYSLSFNSSYYINFNYCSASALGSYLVLFSQLTFVDTVTQVF